MCPLQVALMKEHTQPQRENKAWTILLRFYHSSTFCFKDSYTPTQFFSIKECMVTLKGCVSFLECLPKKPYGWGMKVLPDAHNTYMYIHMKMEKSTLRRSVTMFVIYHGSGKGHQGPSVT